MSEGLQIINQQGAQVVTLQNEVLELQGIVTLLASRIPSATARFNKRQRKQIAERIQGVGWKELKDGTIVVTIHKQKGKK